MCRASLFIQHSMAMTAAVRTRLLACYRDIRFITTGLETYFRNVSSRSDARTSRLHTTCIIFSTSSPLIADFELWLKSSGTFKTAFSSEDFLDNASYLLYSLLTTPHLWQLTHHSQLWLRILLPASTVSKSSVNHMNWSSTQPTPNLLFSNQRVKNIRRFPST